MLLQSLEADDPLLDSPPMSPTSEKDITLSSLLEALRDVDSSSTSTRANKPSSGGSYYLVVDVEATCVEEVRFDYPNEIIEFPCILLDAATGDKIDEYHAFVKPKVNTQLSPYCRQLTGIQQSDIDKAPLFADMLADFEEWLCKHELLLPAGAGESAEYTRNPLKSFCFVTDGPWDLRDFVQKTCIANDLERPWYLCSVVDLRKYFLRTVKHGDRDERTSLDGMLQHLGMSFEGRAHSGADDTHNIARIVQALVKRGYTMTDNWVLVRRTKSSVPPNIRAQKWWRELDDQLKKIDCSNGWVGGRKFRVGNEVWEWHDVNRHGVSRAR
ncbi:hypothetical protein RI367_003664 [Sorochytrium milnesiophthora]